MVAYHFDEKAKTIFYWHKQFPKIKKSQFCNKMAFKKPASGGMYN